MGVVIGLDIKNYLLVLRFVVLMYYINFYGSVYWI